MSSNMPAVRDHIASFMTSNTIRNYAIAGLKSELVDQGVVRLFTQENIQMSMITPHSHRYNLGCLVLSGEVKNTLWSEAPEDYEGPTYYMRVSHQKFQEMGKYEIDEQRNAHFRTVNCWHKSGEFYYMDATEIHSIEFNKGTQVLIFEGPNRFDSSVILEPMGEHDVIPIHETLPWMFQKT